MKKLVPTKLEWYFTCKKYELDRAWSRFSSKFTHHQDWLVKKIPRQWCDKVELIPLVLFEILVNYVEEENGLSQLHVDWSDDIAVGHVSQAYVDNVIKTYTEIETVYNYIKTERPLLQAQHDASYPECNFIMDDGRLNFNYPPGQDYHTTYAETIRLEALIEEKDTWAMNTIIKHSGVLWT